MAWETLWSDLDGLGEPCMQGAPILMTHNGFLEFRRHSEGSSRRRRSAPASAMKGRTLFCHQANGLGWGVFIRMHETAKQSRQGARVML